MNVKCLKYIIIGLLAIGGGFAIWPVSGREIPPATQVGGPAEGSLPNLVHALAKANVQPIEPVAVPDFLLPDLTGQKVRFSDFAGKVLIVNFWTTH